MNKHGSISERSTSVNERLQTKDFVNIGIFAAIYLVGSFVVGTPFGMSVVAYMLYPFAYAVIGAIITVFFMARCQKKWATFLFALLPFLVLHLMTGLHYLLLVHIVAFALIAELLRQWAGLHTYKGIALAHVALSLNMVASYWQIFVNREAYYAKTLETMGETFAMGYLSLPTWVLPVLYVSVIVGAVFGVLLAKRILEKNLEKSGIET
jgi:energy-coupling factor transport system substrate-specific component